MSHAVTFLPGRGGGALEAPQDRHGQDHRTGTSRAEQIMEAMAKLGVLEPMVEPGAPNAMAGARSSGGHGGAGSSGGYGRWSFMAMASSLSQATPAGTLLPPPPQISLGKLGGIRCLLGLDRQDKTGTRQGQDSPPGLNRQEQDSPPGLNRQEQDSPPGLNRQEQDSPQEQEALLG